MCLSHSVVGGYWDVRIPLRGGYGSVDGPLIGVQCDFPTSGWGWGVLVPLCGGYWGVRILLRGGCRSVEGPIIGVHLGVIFPLRVGLGCA